MLAPDPVLTANVYCNGRLDRVVHEALAPALERLRQEEAGTPWLLWWVRYSKTGDHVKVRLHGPAERCEAARRILAEAAAAAFAVLPPAALDEPRITRSKVPSIDAEDDAVEDYPDRTLLWTHYARSHVSFGPKQLLDDDGYVARITTCLGRGAEVVLESTSLGADGAIPAPARQRTLLKVLVAGLAGTGFTAEERTRFLAYHRDWLLRFTVVDGGKRAEVLEGFERRVEGMRPTVEQLARVSAAQWAPAALLSAGDTAEERWRLAVASLAAYAGPFRHDPAFRPDPFTDDGAFPLVFKSFHGIANQVGLDLLNEAFIHHLLLRATEAGAPVRVAVPALAGEPVPVEA
jgi:hypothetical protein